MKVSADNIVPLTIKQSKCIHIFFIYLTHPTAQAPITGWIEIFHVLHILLLNDSTWNVYFQGCLIPSSALHQVSFMQHCDHWRSFFIWRGDDVSIYMYLWDIPQLNDRRYPPFIHHPRWHPLGVRAPDTRFFHNSGARWGPLNKRNTRFMYALCRCSAMQKVNLINCSILTASTCAPYAGVDT